MAHERVFQRIANQNGGTRASGTPGYDASATYVAQHAARCRLPRPRAGVRSSRSSAELAPAVLVAGVARRAGRTRPATFDLLRQRRRHRRRWCRRNDIADPAARRAELHRPAASPSDFAPAPAEAAVALIQRGTCDFAVKAANAEAAGYDAVIIFNEGQPGRTEPVAGHPRRADGHPGRRPHVRRRRRAVSRRSQAGTRSSCGSPPRPSRTSRHHDATSSPTPPGRRPEQADRGRRAPRLGDRGPRHQRQRQRLVDDPRDRRARWRELKAKPRQQVRFAFWGAEEGRPPRLRALRRQPERPAALQRIDANLNFDMLGSPNYVRFVYDGDGSDTPAGGPAGSGEIESVFTDYFASQGLASEPDRVQRSLRLRPVHRGRHPGRRSLHRRRGREDRRSRRRSTAAPPVRPTTPATTRPATTSPTSA